MNRFVILGGLLSALLVVSGRSEDFFQVSKPYPDQPVLLGDFNHYRCEGNLNGNPASDVEWSFELKNGNFVPVNKSDIGESQDNISDSTAFYRDSYIRVNSKDVQALACGMKNQAQLSSSIYKLEVEDFMPINPFEISYCKDGPKVIMKQWGHYFEGIYWLPHVVTNKEVLIGQSTDGLKLSCFSSSPSVKWVLEAGSKLTHFQYRVIPSNTMNPCNTAELVLTSLDRSNPIKFQCRSSEDKTDTWVTLAFTKTRDPIPDFNQTQACVEKLGDVVFGNTTLGWTTAGGGVMSILMMAGMVFLKRQLNQARSNNP